MSMKVPNSHAKIIALLRKFMIEVLSVEPTKIKAQLFLYPDLNTKKVMKEWGRRTGTPIKQFQKVIMLKAKISKFKPNPLGTLKIRYSNKEKFLKLQSIIDSVWKHAVA